MVNSIKIQDNPIIVSYNGIFFNHTYRFKFMQKCCDWASVKNCDGFWWRCEVMQWCSYLACTKIICLFFAFKCKWISWLVDPIVTGVVTCFHILIAHSESHQIFLHCCLHFRYRAIDPLSLWSCHSNVAKMFETNLFENEPEISVTAERSDKKMGFMYRDKYGFLWKMAKLALFVFFFFFTLINSSFKLGFTTFHVN